MLLFSLKLPLFNFACQCKKRNERAQIQRAQVFNNNLFSEYYGYPIGPVNYTGWYDHILSTRPALPPVEVLYTVRTGTISNTYRFTPVQFERLKDGLLNKYTVNVVVGSLTGEVQLRPSNNNYTLRTYYNAQDFHSVVIALTKLEAVNEHNVNRFVFHH